MVHDMGGPVLCQVLADHMWDYGCGFKEHVTGTNIVWGDCFEWEPLFQWGFKTLAFFCPITCGCAEKTLAEQENRRAYEAKVTWIFDD